MTLPHLGIINRISFTSYVYYIFIVLESIIYFYLLVKSSLDIYYEKVGLKKEIIEKQKLYSKALLEEQEKERNRIGRELHDSIGGNLSILNKADMIRNTEAKNILSKTIDSIRDLSHDLVTTNFTKITFKESMIDLVAKYNSPIQNIQLQFHNWPEIEDENVKHHCFRIAQELLNNAVKHSKASQVFLQFFGERNKIGRITYEDNGIGFDPSNITEGIGIRNIKFRALTIEATISIESSKKGTLINIDNFCISNTKQSEMNF